MADGGEAFSARTVASIDEIGRDVWDRLANPDPRAHNPFISFDFLKALEGSQSVGGQSGWAPSHLVVEQAGAVIGVAPLYAKAHSQGEDVFDHHWADAYERAGGRYYPKLVCAAPFTPVPGSRLLGRDATGRAALAAAMIEVTKHVGASSLHANFLRAEDQAALTAAGALPRLGEQYHWFNLGAAPLAGLADHPLATTWNRIGTQIYKRGEDFYHFEGLRSFKQKFDPVWTPNYLACSGGFAAPQALLDITALISGGRLSVLRK